MDIGKLFQAPRIEAAGPSPARILVVGEAPGEEEIKEGLPFRGKSGIEFTKMLHESGLIRSDCRITNVCQYRPHANEIETWIWPRKTGAPSYFVECLGKRVDPRVLAGVEELQREVLATQPNVIIALGGTALWALTGETSISKWRGSVMSSRRIGDRTWKVVPSFHPAAVLREWGLRPISISDLSRAADQSHTAEQPVRLERFIIRPSFATASEVLQSLLGGDDPISADVETRTGEISCIGFGWSPHDAICIPFLLLEEEYQASYWSVDEEFALVQIIAQILAKRKIIGQNFIYDAQYTIKQWGAWPNLFLDTMIEHHTHWLGAFRKGLDFQSSLYLPDHLYWKDEGKEWNPRQHGMEQHWTYNCRDCVVTWRVAQDLLRLRETMPLKDTGYGKPWDIQHSMWPIFLKTMLRGIKRDEPRRFETIMALSEAEKKRQEFINAITGKELNVNSPKQLMAYFYEDLGMDPQKNLKSKWRPTCNEPALEKLGRMEPLLAPLCSAINELRSLKNSHSVCMQLVDGDGRMRCSYDITGTDTLRLSSSTDAFGNGGNLQNVTSGDEMDKDGRPSIFPLPNLRKLFIPDDGYELGEFDGRQADARVVAWDAEDETLMAIFDDPSRDIHNENCELIYGTGSWRDYNKRQKAKSGIHATNYYAQPKTLATTLGCSVHEADLFQRRWFSAHPAIEGWHRRVLSDLQSRRYVENVFGFRRYYFDRIDAILKEALAWIAQSTVALVTNLGIRQVDRSLTPQSVDVQLLLQVHDSSVWQWPIAFSKLVIPAMLETLKVTIPYPRPLLIPMDVKTSTKSWGDCKKLTE